MTRFLWPMILVLAGCASGAKVGREPQAIRGPRLDELVGLLTPHVVPLDRDMLVFRYEHDARPRSIADVIASASKWALRFWDAQIKTGDDVGPGLFAATDPNATATWGFEDPQLLVMKIKKGSNVLVGDTRSVTADELSRIQTLSDALGCQNDDDRRDRPLDTIGELVGTFRDSDRKECRRLVVAAARRLGVHAIAYSFNSTVIDACRFTGTAINVVAPAAVAWDQMNWYSRGRSFENAPEQRSFIKTLFDEGKNDFQAQKKLSTRALWASYRRDFDFFGNVGTAIPVVYEEWRGRNVFKCGPRWSPETDDSTESFRKVVHRSGEPALRNLWIRTGLLYSELYKRKPPTAVTTSSEFQIENLRAVQTLAFRSSGLAATAENERELAQARDDESSFALQRFAKLFGETAPQMRLSEVGAAVGRYLREGHFAHSRAEIAMPLALARVGLGPRLTREIYNDLALDEGLIPRFVGPLPRSERDDSSAVLAENEKMLREILERCAKVYEDPDSNVEAVSRTECGVGIKE